MIDEPRKKWALQWLYTHCSDKWFRPEVLDKKSNLDKTLTESFSPPEYMSILETLRIEAFILPAINEHGEPCFIMNQMKGAEWVEKIASINPSKLRIVGKTAKSGFFFTVREIITASIGGLIALFLAYIVSKI